MDIRLIATDMDDTLLNEEDQVSERTRRAIQAAQAAGVKVTLASGRMYCVAKKYADRLGIDIPLITYNGALVRAGDGTDLWCQPIEEEVAFQVLALFRDKGWYLQSYIDDVVYVDRPTEESRYYERMNDLIARPIGAEFYTRAAGHLKLLAVSHNEPLLTEIREEVTRRFGDRLYIANSKSCYLEMTNPAVNKGRALAILGRHLGIRPEQIMAVGDGTNDIEMLRVAGFGVAMGNAKPQVQAAADAVTATNREDGLAQAIEQYVLQG